MALKILFNSGLMAFFIYCYVYISMTAPPAAPNEMDGAQWPKILLGLLIFFLIINIVNIWRATPQEKRNMGSITGLNYKGIYKSKLFIGIALLLVYASILEYAGFLLASFLFAAAYIILLGERRIPRAFLYSFICVVILYLLFSRILDIMLPRGVGPLRDFALMLESIGG